MQVGDILLVTGKATKSKLLVLGQKLVSYRKCISSHVLFCVSDGIFIDATTDKKVGLKFILDELDEIEPTWRVLRYPNLSPAQIEQLRIAATYYLKQGYNFKYYISGSSESSFCSELVIKIYEKAGIELFDGRKAHTISPAYFDRVADNGKELIDVTVEAKEYLESVAHLQTEHRLLFEQYKYLIETAKFKNQSRDPVTEMIMAISSPETRVRIAALELEREKATKVKFWDDEPSKSNS